MDLKFRDSSRFPLFFLRFLRREETDERAGAHVARDKARAARRPAARAVVHGTPANFRKLLDGQLKKLVAAGKLTRVKNSFKLAAAGRELAVGEFFLFFSYFSEIDIHVRLYRLDLSCKQFFG